MARAAIAAHHARAATAGIHHVLHRVVAAHIAQNLLENVDAGARCRCDLADHGHRAAVFTVQGPQALQGACAVKLQNNDLLLINTGEIQRPHVGRHGNVNPGIIVKGALGGGGAEQIDRIRTGAGTGVS